MQIKTSAYIMTGMLKSSGMIIIFCLGIFFLARQLGIKSGDSIGFVAAIVIAMAPPIVMGNYVRLRSLIFTSSPTLLNASSPETIKFAASCGLWLFLVYLFLFMVIKSIRQSSIAGVAFYLIVCIIPMWLFLRSIGRFRKAILNQSIASPGGRNIDAGELFRISNCTLLLAITVIATLIAGISLPLWKGWNLIGLISICLSIGLFLVTRQYVNAAIDRLDIAKTVDVPLWYLFI